MTISLRKLRSNSKRVDRLNTRVAAARAAMKRGAALLLEFRWYGRAWCLSNGRIIDDEVAQVLIKDPQIADVGDALQIDGARPQMWRWIGD